MSDFDLEPSDTEKKIKSAPDPNSAQANSHPVRNTLLGIVGAALVIVAAGGAGWFAFNAGRGNSGAATAVVFARSNATSAQGSDAAAHASAQPADHETTAVTTGTTDLANTAALTQTAGAPNPTGGGQRGPRNPGQAGGAGAGFPGANGAADGAAAGEGAVATTTESALAAPADGANPLPAQTSGLPADATTAAQPATTINTQPNALEQAAVRTTVATQPVTLASIPAIVSDAATPLLSDEGVALASLASGDTLRAIARSADNQWLAVRNDSDQGWVQRNALIAFGVADLATANPPAAVTDTAVESAGNADSSAVALVTTGPALERTAEAAPAEAGAGAAPASAQPAGLEATVSAGAANLNVRTGPGTDYAIVAKAPAGSALSLTARNAAADWLKVLLPTGESGWTAARFLNYSGDIPSLPVETSTAVPLPATPAANASAASGAAAASIASSTNSATAATAAAEPLSGKLAFQQGPGGMIWTYDFATGATDSLTNGFDPAISPDGSTIAFVREGGETGLYLINSDGSNERKIFGERGRLSAPKWSDDGQSILFGRGDEYYECYPIGQNECLTEDEFARRFPKGAPKGLDVALERRYFDKLSVVDADGNNFRDIPSLTSAKAADWANGEIVYQSSAGLQRTADSTSDANQTVVFEPLLQQFVDPDLQPGGSEIAYQMKGAAQWDIWAVNLDGTNRHGLTRAATTLVNTLPSNVAPAFSPDGKHIVYLSNRQDDNEAGDWRLWVMQADGSNAHVLPIDVPIAYDFGAEQIVSWGG